MVKSMGLTIDQYTQLYAMTYRHPVNVNINAVNESKLREAVLNKYKFGKRTAYDKLLNMLDSVDGDIKFMITVTRDKIFVITKWRANTAVTTLNHEALPEPKNVYVPKQIAFYACGFDIA